ncbi:MAG: hypothetical protein ACRDLQ_02730 [Solirubrobacterales bacterium]
MPRLQGVLRGPVPPRAGLTLVLVALFAWVAPAAATPVFLSPIDISDAGEDAFEPQVAVDPSGNEHHVWTRFDGANTRIQYRFRDQIGSFSAVQTLSAAGQDASQPAMDVNAAGDVVAVWTRSDGSHLRVEAAVRPAGGPFGGTQIVSVAGQATDQPRVSIDDSGRAVAAWVSYDVGTGGTGRIQAAVRPPSGSFGAAQTISDEGQVTVDPQVESGPAVDTNAVVVWSRSDGSTLRVQSARRRDVVGFPRPRAASPLTVSLVPAYNECTSANRTHGPALAFPSCNPPVRTSSPLTVGTPDANGAVANSTASVRYAVISGDPITTADEADVKVSVSITDVRNHPSLSDYTGRLLLTSPLRITDQDNAPERPEPGTTQERPFQLPLQCSATVDTTRGGQCTLTTTYDSVIPGAVTERIRAIWALGQVEVRDAGPNGSGYASCPPTCGDGDETVFMRQGIFIP